MLDFSALMDYNRIHRKVKGNNTMPQLRDAVSKLTLSPETAHQESYKTKILRWMQDNPDQTKNTTYALMARTMSLGRVTGQKEKDILLTLYNMSNDGLITYSGSKVSRSKTFFINYLHKNCPAVIRERAPKKDLDRAKAIVGIVESKLPGIKKDSAEKIKSLGDPDESVEVQDEEEPIAEPVAEPDAKSVTEPVKEEIPAPEVKAQEISPAPTVDVPIELNKMPNGNFTLQLNINFTINSKN